MTHLLQVSKARLVFLVCLALGGYFVYTAAVGALRNHQLASERDKVAQDVAVLEQKKAYLDAVKSYVASDAYVEQQARRQLGYVRDGEVPFVIIGPPLPQQRKASGDWWERLFPQIGRASCRERV